MSPEPSLTIDPTSATTRASGNVSMSLTNQRIGYLDLHSPGEEGFDTYGYLTIDLFINRGDCKTFTPQLVGGYKFGGGFSHDLTKIATFPENEWVQVSLSLEDLGANHQVIEMIRIGGHTPGTFYLDNLRLVSGIPEITPLLPITILLISIYPMRTRYRRRTTHSRIHGRKSKILSKREGGRP